MTTVSLSFSPLPVQVRTARLMAAALGRRSGMPEDLLDEVWLAVGEVCSRAVAVHARAETAERIQVEFVETDDGFTVTVTDDGDAAAAVAAAQGDPDASWEDALDEDVDGQGPLPAGLDLAMVHGLVDDVAVTPSPSGGTCVRLHWPR